MKVTYKTSQSYSHTIEQARNVLTAQKSSIHMVVNFKCVVSYFFAVFSLYHHKRFTDVIAGLANRLLLANSPLVLG